MSDALSRLLILLEAKDEASPTLKKAGESAKGLGTELTNIGKIAAGVALGSAGAQLGMSLSEHFKDAITEVENFGNQVFQLQQRIGISSQSASGLLSIFERFGVSGDEAQNMLTKFSRNLRGQADETEGGALALTQFQGTLSELGVSALDANGNFRPLVDVLTDVQDRISKVKDDGQTGARAIALFGRAGAQLAPLLNLSSEEFRKLQEEAARLGVVLTEQNVAQVRQLAIAHKELDEATRGLAIQTGLLVTGPLTAAAKAAADMASAFTAKVVPAIQQAEREYEIWKKMVQAGAQQLPGYDPKAQIDPDRKGTASDLSQSPVDYFNKIVKPQLDKLGKGLADLGHALDVGDNNGALPPGGAILKGVKNLFPVTLIADEVAQSHAAAFADVTGAHNLNLPDDKTDRAKAKAADAAREARKHSDALLALDQADAAGKRGLEVVQHQLNVLQRDNLDLVRQTADAELALIPIKQQQAALELQLLETQDQRAQIERETAVNRARLAAMPSSAALEDNQYGQNLIQAQIRANALNGRGIDPDDIKRLIGLKFAEADLQVNALKAGHAVTVAERGQQAGDLRTDIATAPIRMSLADVMLDAAKAQQGADAAAAAQRIELLGKTQQIIDLERQRRDLEDKLFDIQQKNADLRGTTVSVQLTVNEAGGQPDYDKLIKDLANAVTAAMDRASHNLELPAPSTVPGGGF